MYARQLAEHYDGAASMGQQRDIRRSAERGRPKQTGLKPNEPYDEGRSFLDDDLPAIKENLRRGFVETQKTVNNWITNLKKKIDGEDVGSGPSEDGQGAAQTRPNQPYGPRRSGDSRRSGDYNRYDADPQVLGDDFAGIQLNDDGSELNLRGN
jgi:CDK inhibitor PHO81